MEPRDVLQSGDAVVVVDVQNDFCPGGALAVAEGDQVIPPLNEWIAAAVDKGVPVYASRDWHPQDHLSFQDQGGDWPPHCVQDTPGAAFHPDLKLPADVIKVTKGVRFDQDQYSVFDETGLADYLRGKGVRRLWVGGLAQDVCVAASVRDACQAGFEVHVLVEATRAISAASGEKALAEMAAAGATIERAA